MFCNGVTTVANLNLGAAAAITTDLGQTVSALNVTAPSITVTIAGPGVIASLTASATGLSIYLAADVTKDSITKVSIFISIVFTGNADTIKFLVIVVSTPGATATSPSTGVTPGSSAGTGGTGGTTPTVPASVTNLTYADVTSSGAKLTWSAVSDVTGYNIYQGNSSTASATVTTASYTITGLSTGTAYDYTVKAYNSVGESTGASVSFKTNSVTSVTYVTYNTSATVSGSVYSGIMMLVVLLPHSKSQQTTLPIS